MDTTKMGTIKIRTIRLEDNAKLGNLVRKVLETLGVPKKGTAYEDKSLDTMHTTYLADRSAYFVAEDQGTLLGGAGIAQLQGADFAYCELQKMYLLPEARGRGIGTKLMENCLQFAKKEAYTHCYLETMPYMKAAQRLYLKFGFQPLTAAMGDTGHYNCQAWMLKALT